MTAKDKAKELIQLFYNKQCSHSITELAYKSAKQCALIDIGNTIEALWNVGHSSCNDEIEYHREVKQEIIKL